MLASVYTNDEERGHAIGIALGGLALGVLGMYTYKVQPRNASVKGHTRLEILGINKCIYISVLNYAAQIKHKRCMCLISIYAL